MKHQTVTRLSLNISVGIALLVLIILTLFKIPDNGAKIFLVILVSAGVFLVSYFLIRLVLNLFIKEQIHPIYRTVHELTPRDDPSMIKSISQDIIAEVEEEVRDWAEEKKSEVEKLKGLESYRKEFLGNVYHELKTPIFNLQGYILTLLEGGLEDPAINRLYLERTEKNINRMISIVEDLESISSMESGAYNLKIETFNIRKIVEEVFDSNEMRATRHGIRLGMKKARDSDVIVKGDRKRIYQVVNNLITNSISYGVEDGKTTVSFTPAVDKILIEVRDNGIGINEKDLSRVFERFYRVDKSRSRESGGTGLGLAIVKHILEAHNQTVHVTSSTGKGSTFAFTLEKG